MIQIKHLINRSKDLLPPANAWVAEWVLVAAVLHICHTSPYSLSFSSTAKGDLTSSGSPSSLSPSLSALLEDASNHISEEGGDAVTMRTFLESVDEVGSRHCRHLTKRHRTTASQILNHQLIRMRQYVVRRRHLHCAPCCHLSLR